MECRNAPRACLLGHAARHDGTPRAVPAHGFTTSGSGGRKRGLLRPPIGAKRQRPGRAEGGKRERRHRQRAAGKRGRAQHAGTALPLAGRLVRGRMLSARHRHVVHARHGHARHRHIRHRHILHRHAGHGGRGHSAADHGQRQQRGGKISKDKAHAPSLAAACPSPQGRAGAVQGPHPFTAAIRQNRRSSPSARKADRP